MRSFKDKILIETEGERIGQINAFRVIEFPVFHPLWRTFAITSYALLFVLIYLIIERKVVEFWRAHPCESG